MLNQKPTSDLDNHLLKCMCIEAAKGVELQCVREYWAETENPRTTQLHKLTPSERENIPTENMASERYLARFGSLASISAKKKAIVSLKQNVYEMI